MPLFVIPAKAGIQNLLAGLDARFRGNDGLVRVCSFRVWPSALPLFDEYANVVKQGKIYANQNSPQHLTPIPVVAIFALASAICLDASCRA